MFLRYNYASILWALLIVLICGIPGGQLLRGEHGRVDKFVHLILFAVWFYLLAVGFIKQSSIGYLRKSPLIKAFMIAITYGLIIELLQWTVFVQRSMDVNDLIANMIGSLTGLSFFLSIYGLKSYT